MPYMCIFVFSADGCCRHVAALLMETEALFIGASCTDEPLKWIKQARPQDHACEWEELTLSSKR